MKEIIEIESAEELVRFARQNRAQGDTSPYVNPSKNELILKELVA